MISVVSHILLSEMSNCKKDVDLESLKHRMQRCLQIQHTGVFTLICYSSLLVLCYWVEGYQQDDKTRE